MAEIADVGRYGDEVVLDLADGQTLVREAMSAGADLEVDIGGSYYKAYNFEVREDGDVLAYTHATANHGGMPVKKPLGLKDEVREALEDEFGVTVVDARE